MEISTLWWVQRSFYASITYYDTNKLLCCRGRLVQWKNTRFVKFFVRGERGSIPAEAIFSDVINLQYVWRWPNNRTGTSNLATSNRRQLLRHLHCMKRERNLEKWLYDVIQWSHILYYATLATYYNNQSRIVNLRRTAEMLIGNRPRKMRMAHKTRAGRRIIGDIGQVMRYTLK